MDTDSDSLNMNNLEEMILDENKLVTYLYLSRKLCIHVNESKLLLQEFVKKQKKKDINVQFVISGMDHDNKLRTFICPEGDLVKTQNSFKKLFFHHIYSVRKGHESVDTLSLANVDKFSELIDCIGFIKSSTCLKHSNNEIATLKQNSLTAVCNKDNIKSQTATKTIKAEKSTSNSSIGQEPATKPVTPKKQEEPKIDKTSPKKAKSDIAHFFNKQNGAVRQVKNDEKPPNMMNSFIKKGNDVKKDIEPLVESNMKENCTTNNKTHKINKSESVTLKKDRLEPENKSNETAINSEANISIKEKNKPAGFAKVKAKSKSYAQIKKNGKVDKKRKRVLQMTDSEDSDKEKDDIFEDETPVKMEVSDDDDVIPPTPDAHLIKFTSDKMNPKKKRKIVDKTYTDEEGYILTKKVEVYESCSEDETCNKGAGKNKNHDIIPDQTQKKETNVEPIVKEDASKSTPKQKKKISPPKGKQATLMNFFKKKT